VIEHHPEDWVAFVLFWALAFIVFCSFSPATSSTTACPWTEEIARYG